MLPSRISADDDIHKRALINNNVKHHTDLNGPRSHPYFTNRKIDQVLQTAWGAAHRIWWQEARKSPIRYDAVGVYRPQWAKALLSHKEIIKVFDLDVDGGCFETYKGSGVANDTKKTKVKIITVTSVVGSSSIMISAGVSIWIWLAGRYVRISSGKMEVRRYNKIAPRLYSSNTSLIWNTNPAQMLEHRAIRSCSGPAF